MHFDAFWLTLFPLLQSFWNQVPLTRAVEIDNYEIAHYLCEHGSDLEAETYVRESLLRRAFRAPVL